MKEDVLPEGWEKTKLGKYLYLKNGYAFKKTDYVEKSKHSYPIIRISDINNFTATDKNAIHTNYIAKGFELEKNDLLIAMSGATTGKLGVYKGNVPAYQNQRVGNLKLIGKGDSQFRNYLMLSLQELIEKLAYGGAQPNISGKIIEDIDINLPPLPEQQYLSQKLTALLDEVAQTKQRLETIPALLKQFRQSVLADAVSGRLTEEWREENEAILTVDDLTKKLNSFKSKTKNLDPLIQNNKWVSCQLGHLLTVKSGDGLTAKQMIDGEIPVYGGNGINGFHNQFNVEQPTIVIGRVGFYCGSVHLTEEKSWITDNALIVNFYSEVITQGFIYYLLKHLNLGRLSSSTAQPVVSGSKIYSVRINLPTLKEQTQIVQKVETYFALASEIETQVNTVLENVNLLTQSILAKAFSGELSAAWRNSQVTETQGNV